VTRKRPACAHPPARWGTTTTRRKQPETCAPLGLGSGGLPPLSAGVVPRPGGGRKLRRQWTTAKPYGGGAARNTRSSSGGGGGVACAALPFFLDLSLAFAPGAEFFDSVKSSVDSEVVFQATLQVCGLCVVCCVFKRASAWCAGKRACCLPQALPSTFNNRRRMHTHPHPPPTHTRAPQVPAHHALACRMAAYGTPFAAPDLQAPAHELGDEDLEFAACLASPPDLDEQLSMNFGRLMSILQRNEQQAQQTQAQQQGGAAAAQQRAGGGGAAAQLRGTPGGAAQQQQAPRVLVSVDDAESGAAQLQRQASTKKQ
jgi:hypothetical protein